MLLGLSFGGQGAQVLAIEGDRTVNQGIGGKKVHQGLGGHCLAGTGFPDDPHGLAGFEVEGHPVDGMDHPDRGREYHL